MTETDAGIGIDENAARVRPAMGELCRHGASNRLQLLRPWATL